jgi:hypothetical protein
MKFVGVREFKQDAVRYLNEGNEIVVMKRKERGDVGSNANYRY